MAKRIIDAQGRVLIPAHIRKALNMTDGKFVEVTQNGNGVMITPSEHRCDICGRIIGNHKQYKSKKVCIPCMKALNGGKEHDND